MGYLSKIATFVMLFALIFQSFNPAVHAVSGLASGESDKREAIVLLDENEKDIPLFEDESESSKVLYRLKNEDVVEILKEFDAFTYVEYISEETKTLYRGYVDSGYLINEVTASEELPVPDSENEIIGHDEFNKASDDSNQSNSKTGEKDDTVDSTSEDGDLGSESDEEIANEDSETTTEITDDVDESENDTEIIQEDLTDDNNSSKKANEKNREKEHIETEEPKSNDNKDSFSDQSVQSSKRAAIPATSKNQQTSQGIALKSPTNVYSKQSTKASVLKSYQQGHILKFKKLNSKWYEATVYVNGTAKNGFINVNDVEIATKSQKSLQGVGLKSPTNVYKKASSTSKVLKSYRQGAILKYKSYTAGWYEATVYINGKPTTGYINVKDVGKNPSQEDSQTVLKGFGLKSPTNVYERNSTGAKVLKSYQQGAVLKYKAYTSDWYITTVYINGKPTTGYINVKDVGKSPSQEESQTILKGVGLKSPTNVYEKNSTGAKVLKSYRQGAILKYKAYTSEWYITTVYINGKPTTGYIHKSHVENSVNKPVSLKGIGLNSPTAVYASASTNSKKLKTYAQGAILQYKTFSGNWYEATVYINGKPTTGYIHANHVEELFTTNKTEKGLASKSPTKVYSRASQSAPVLKRYSRNSALKFETFSPNWYRATVYVNGKKKTGYISHKDVNQNDIVIDKSSYKHNFNDVVDIQMTRSPQVWKNGTFVDASREQVSYYLNSSNFKPNTSGYLQFLNLSSPAGVNANEINAKVLHNAGILTGMAQAFIEAGRKYNVNEIYLMSHALHETGNGKSTLAKGVPVDKNGNVVAKNKAAHTVYNMYGYGAIDSDPLNGGAKYAFKNGWFTPEAAIIGGAKDIANNYVSSGQNTLYKMRWNPVSPGYPQYATDVAWALAQTANISKIYDSLSNYVLVYDVPVYNSQPTSSGDPNKYKDTKVSLEVTATSINVRSGAGTSYRTVGGVRKGNVLKAVLDKNNNVVKKTANGHIWYQIHFNGSTAWISGGKNGTEYIKVR